MNCNAECRSQHSLERQLYASQQKIRDESSRRTDSYLHFAISTGTLDSSYCDQSKETVGEYNAVKYVEDSLMLRNSQNLRIKFHDHYEAPNQFKKASYTFECYSKNETEEDCGIINCDD